MDMTLEEVIELTSSSDSSTSSDPDFMGPRSQRRRMNNKENNSAGTSRNGNIELTSRGLRLKMRSINYEDGGEARGSQQAIQGRPTTRRRRRRTRRASCNATTSISSKSNTAIERTILSWLIEQGIVEKNEALICDILLSKVGRATRDGIFCGCCYQIMTVSEFAAHAGSARPDRPYEDVRLVSTNESLLRCQIKAWECEEEEKERCKFNQFMPKDGAIDKSDDSCLICADGGDLLCCERCPSTYHPSCIGMEGTSQEEWLCPYCVCKLCGRGDGVLVACTHCEKKYHWRCLIEKTSCDLNSQALESSFCGPSCREVYARVQSLIGVKNVLGGGLCWTLLQRMEPSDLLYDNEHVRVECNSKIAIAWEVLNECFRANIDRYTGVNIVQSVVYGRGSDLMRINFRRFYTAVLEKNDGIISVATIRIHGNELAEMPFIATLHSYRQEGMSRILLRALQSMFNSLGVPQLLIPSVTELVQMWESKYGFSSISDALKQSVARYNTVMFLGTVRLQKSNMHV